MDIIDVIPVSVSQILENLNSKEIELSIPQLMGHLMELNYKGKIIQEGVYYRKKMDVWILQANDIEIKVAQY